MRRPKDPAGSLLGVLLLWVAGFALLLFMVTTAPPSRLVCPRGTPTWELVSYSLNARGDEVNCHYVKHITGRL